MPKRGSQVKVEGRVGKVVARSTNTMVVQFLDDSMKLVMKDDDWEPI